MATLTEIARERRRGLRQLRAPVNELVRDGVRMQRFLKQVINRRRAIPSTADFERLTSLASEVERQLDVTIRNLERVVAPSFSI